MGVPDKSPQTTSCLRSFVNGASRRFVQGLVSRLRPQQLYSLHETIDLIQALEDMLDIVGAVVTTVPDSGQNKGLNLNELLQ